MPQNQGLRMLYDRYRDVEGNRRFEASRNRQDAGCSESAHLTATAWTGTWMPSGPAATWN